MRNPVPRWMRIGTFPFRSKRIMQAAYAQYLMQQLHAKDPAACETYVQINEALGEAWYRVPGCDRYHWMLWNSTVTFKDTNSRFWLTCFLLNNKVKPELIAAWYIQRDMLRDEAASRDVIDIIKKHREGKLVKFSTPLVDPPDVKLHPVLRKNQWDPYTPKDKGVVENMFPVDTPHFAFNWQDQHYWDAATSMIEKHICDKKRGH